MLLALLLALATPPPQCPSVELSVGKGGMAARFGPALLKQVKASFSQAYAKACAKGILKSESLLPKEARGRLYLLNAPEANVASIYTADNGQTLLEYYFVTADGKTHVPPAEELEEAIYCRVVGATEAEQEESGRCLPD